MNRCLLPVLAAAGLLAGCAVVPYDPYAAYYQPAPVVAPVPVAPPVVYSAPAYVAPPPVLFNFSYRNGGRGPWRPGYYGGARWGAYGRFGW